MFLKVVLIFFSLYCFQTSIYNFKKVEKIVTYLISAASNSRITGVVWVLRVFCMIRNPIKIKSFSTWSLFIFCTFSHFTSEGNFLCATPITLYPFKVKLFNWESQCDFEQLQSLLKVKISAHRPIFFANKWKYSSFGSIKNHAFTSNTING